MTRPYYLLALSSLVVFLSGCAGSILSAAGPSYQELTQVAHNPQVEFDVIDLNPGTIQPYMLEPTLLQRPVLKGGYGPVELMAGDVLTVMIAQVQGKDAVFAPLSSGGTTFTDVRLDHRGQIDLPYVGSINAKGKTPRQLESAIRQRLSTSLDGIQVRVTLTSDVSSSVLVSGAIKNPGRYSMLKGPLTLLDVITQAGGATAEAHLINVTIREQGSVEELPLNEVLYGHNRLLQPRAEVVLERNRKSVIAMGAVGNAGLFDLPSSNASLLQVLGLVGGLQQATADPSGVFLFRRGGFNDKGQPIAKVFRLDMSRPESLLLASAFKVESGDALYVTNAGVYEAQKIISPIVQMIILGNTVTGN